ncbi:MAG: redox-sensitive bicupin YhaK (pirin superfamily) [Myxococcota bacterium]|jgi:redox-sensitive bicupin YhaK (pirin superfamily)
MAGGKLRIKAPPPPADGPVSERRDARLARIGQSTVRRLLPHPRRRLIGAWCFLDHFGPSVSTGDGGDIGLHPHIGLQTVTWLLEGELVHRDSTGSVQQIRPGQLNWMTAGRGIAHAEQDLRPAGARTHGVQLWVALPGAVRDMAPGFEHYPELPQVRVGGGQAVVLAGTLAGVRSPAHTHSPLLGADITLPDSAPQSLVLRTDFEHGVAVLEGSVTVAGERLEVGTLLYLGRGRQRLELAGAPAGRLLLLGGLPLGEPVRMWWNYVFREPDEVRDAVAAWNGRDTDRFPELVGYTGPRIDSPDWIG